MSLQLLALWSASLCCGVSLPAFHRESVDDRAYATAMGLRIFEDAVRTLQWRQVAVLDEDNPQSDELVSSHVIDDQGRWSCHTISRHFDSAAGDWRERVEIFVYDGNRLYTANGSNGTGLLRGYAGERRTQVAIDCWMGRHIDVAATRRLSDLLLQAPDLAYVGQSPAGLPVISATVSVLPGVFELQVEVDVHHGCAPRTITVRDRAVRVPYYTYETLEYTRIGDVWLPKRGRLMTRAFSPTKQEMEDLTAALARRDIARETANFRDPAVQGAYREAVLEVWGQDEARSEPLTTPIVVEADYLHVNGMIPVAEFSQDRFVEFELLDTIEGRLKPAGSREWRKQSVPP